MDRRCMFPPELRTMSVVPRWSIVWTLTRDTLTNHTYFVIYYCWAIAELIKWTGDVGNLMFRAVAHDMEETITGDIVSPVKSEIIDNERSKIFIDRKMRERFPYVMNVLDRMRKYEEIDGVKTEEDEAHRIIKAADRMDALIFMITEQRLGNHVIAPHLPKAWNQMEAAWRNLPCPDDNLDCLWSTVVLPALRDHQSNGGWGL